ncbi:hypothetical protein [Clostridium sporogenes]|uniref:hypothetical protein n=1 Tax=Clostridium sporogenes TaxID=1509 RepID=UPI0006B28B75|nr:hypothetical protein [Clostridium sporogenes]KOY64045.1 hypothetical protein AN649_20755 [Clostridium sporogenes]NFF69415.1 hypothetical protein [Clostridium sporogenes]NFG00690.1 hypothetical protein [Clostridium sporogenes]NFG08264.1 hypothetical protein [Clostridium sporogenes]NFG53388.1 hypothetical protein [Clostridium sporogenes]
MLDDTYMIEEPYMQQEALITYLMRVYNREHEDNVTTKQFMDIINVLIQEKAVIKKVIDSIKK